MVSVETDKHLVWGDCQTFHNSLDFGEQVACSSSPFDLFRYTMQAEVPEKVAPRSHSLVADIKLIDISGK